MLWVQCTLRAALSACCYSMLPLLPLAGCLISVINPSGLLLLLIHPFLLSGCFLLLDWFITRSWEATQDTDPSSNSSSWSCLSIVFSLSPEVRAQNVPPGLHLLPLAWGSAYYSRKSRGSSAGVRRCHAMIQTVQQLPVTPAPALSWGLLSPFQSSETPLVFEVGHRAPSPMCLPVFWAGQSKARIRSKNSGTSEVQLSILSSHDSCRASSACWFSILSSLSSPLLLIPFCFSSYLFLHDINTKSWIFLLPPFLHLSHGSVLPLLLTRPCHVMLGLLELLAIPWFLGLRSKKELCMN